MITVLTDKDQIAQLQQKFKNQLDRFLNEEIECWIGYHGGSFKETALYSKELNIWMSNFDYEKLKINLFGIGKPVEGGMNSIIGQINFPLENINRRVAGVFAIEDNKNILVLHRGKIGGGKPGIGKNLVFDNYRGDFVTAIDGERETEFCLVGELDSSHLPRQIANFIHEIARIKVLEDGNEPSDFEELANFSYTDESSGQTITERTDPLVVERIHGIVVNALATELQTREHIIGNDRNRDLFIHNGKEISTLFEVKTSSSPQSLYTTVGQLIIYSIPIKNKVDLIAVLPTKLSKTVTNRLDTLGIKLLYYRWEKGNPIFIGLDKLLKK
jgi:hypothetical protein